MTDLPRQRSYQSLWRLLLLALLLAGGSYLWQGSVQQSLLEQVDGCQRLIYLAARDILPDFIPDETAPDPCTRLQSFLGVSDHSHQIAVYATANELICATAPIAELNGINPQPNSVPATNPIVFAAATDNRNHRLSLWIADENPHPFHAIVIASSIATVEDHLNKVRFLLLLTCLFMLTVAGSTERIFHYKRQADVIRIAQAMNRVSLNHKPEKLSLSAASSPELTALIDTYNRMTEQMSRDLRQVHQFSSDAAHELRAPLTILRGETELALRKPKDTETLRKTLESNLEEIKRMGHLIEDVLLLSSSIPGQMPLRIAPLCMEDLLRELHYQARMLSRDKGLDVVLEVPHADGRTLIKADDLRLRQVFLNLISNAIRYTPAKGTVCIRMDLCESEVMVTIKDTGIGIESQHLKRIFDRFYRIDNDVRDHDGGTGLGLAIVKLIVAAHQGRVEASSTPGVGSTFTVHLPLPKKETE